jgi:hypothetical protein
MKFILCTGFMLLLPLAGNAQMKTAEKVFNLYLQKSNGRVKKFKSNVILEFKLDSISYLGRVKTVSEKSITVLVFNPRYPKGTSEHTFEIGSVKTLTNRLVNRQNLSDVGGWVIAGSLIGLIFYVPGQWIAVGGAAAMEALGQVGVMAGAGFLFQLPYLFKKSYVIGDKWKIIEQK